MSAPWEVLIAHAPGEESVAEALAAHIKQAGYTAVHLGTMLVGESVVEQASKVLQMGGPVVLCGTVKALGTGWAHRLVNAARKGQANRVFVVQIDQDAYVQQLAFDDVVADYWRDREGAIAKLLLALQRYFPPCGGAVPPSPEDDQAERRYRELALESCDIIDLANLPESDRHLATRKLELRRLYVPLRVQVGGDTNIDPERAALEALERGPESAGVKGHKYWKRLRRLRRAQERRRQRERTAVGIRLAKARRLVILGDPGAGKSTLVRWVATAYLLRLKREPAWKDLPDVSTLPDEDWLPVLVRCRDLDSDTALESLEEVLRHTLRRAEMTAAQSDAFRQSLQRRLAAGSALLLVDGLDEIADPVMRARFVRQIEQIHVAYPTVPIIVTSRVVGYRELGLRIGRGFEHLTIADLLPKDKDHFARRWSELTEVPERRAAGADELIRDIHSTDRIELLTRNPMLLTTLALVKRKVGKLPRRRTDLYYEAVQVLLNWRAEVDEPIDPYEALPQLEYLASPVSG
jgi:hypothetical protein